MRVFDMADGQTIDAVRRGTGILDKNGFVQPGVINSFGLDERALKEIENADITHIGFELRAGRAADLVFKQLARGRDKTGEMLYTNMAHLVTTMTQTEKHQMEVLSKVAWNRTLALDIETSYGKKRWLSEYARMRDSVDSEEALGEMLQNMGSRKAQALHADLLSAVNSGDSMKVIEASRNLRSSDDVDWITQMAMAEQRHVGTLGEANSAWNRTGVGVNLGRANTGARAAKYLTDEEFELGIDELIREGIKQRTKRGAIIGLNVDKFDMRVIREQAWRTGEAALAKSDALGSALPRLSNAMNSDQAYAALDEISQAAGISIRDRALVQRATQMAPVLKSRAGKMLGYSGKWTGSRWQTHTRGVARSAMESWGMADSMADAFQYGDLTAMARQFLVDSLGGERAWSKNGGLAEKRARLHVLGNENGLVKIKGTSERLKSASVLAWGRHNDTISKRMKLALVGVDENEMRSILAKARSVGDVDEEALAQIERGYFKWHAQINSGVEQNRLMSVGDAMGDFDKVRVNKELERLRKLWGEAKISAIKESVTSSIGSAESLLYTRTNAWRKFIGNKKFFEAPAHTGNRDINVINTMGDEVFRTAKELGKFATGAITDIPHAVLTSVKEGGLGKGMKLFFAGYGGEEGSTRGARGKMYAFESQLIKAADEHLGQMEYESLFPRTRGGRGAIEKAGMMYSNQINRVSRRASGELGRSLGVFTDVATIEKNVGRGIGIAGALTVAAGLIIAGTIHKKNHRNDDVWKYGPTEDKRAIEMRRINKSDNSMGNMVTEMSTRKNYSYNMRPDKHKHLFGG